MTKADSGIRIKAGRPQNPVMTMITPGRRALGEGWSKVTVTPNADTGKYDVSRSDTEAPADGAPIFVPAMGNVSMEMADFMLEHSRHKAIERAKNPQRPRTESMADEINEAWLDYMEMKLKALRGTTQSGPGGWTQRERFNRE